MITNIVTTPLPHFIKVRILDDQLFTITGQYIWSIEVLLLSQYNWSLTSFTLRAHCGQLWFKQTAFSRGESLFRKFLKVRKPRGDNRLRAHGWTISVLITNTDFKRNNSLIPWQKIGVWINATACVVSVEQFTAIKRPALHKSRYQISLLCCVFFKRFRECAGKTRENFHHRDLHSSGTN